MSDSDVEYLQRRAEQEIELARLSTKPEVVAVHYALAEMYLQRVAKARGSTSESNDAPGDAAGHGTVSAGGSLAANVSSSASSSAPSSSWGDEVGD